MEEGWSSHRFNFLGREATTEYSTSLAAQANFYAVLYRTVQFLSSIYTACILRRNYLAALDCTQVET
jgi:hypothetical protein